MSERIDFIPEEEKSEPKFVIDALVVFGFSIRSDHDLEKMGYEKDQSGDSPYKPARLSLGAKLRAIAAAEVYLSGQVGDVIFTGGRTKKSSGVEESEAELFSEYFLHLLEKRKRAEEKSHLRATKAELSQEDLAATEQRVREFVTDAREHIIKEDKSTNTIENFANAINFLDAKKGKYQSIGLLSNKFHLERIMKLAAKFGIDGGVPVAAESAVFDKRAKYQKIVDNYFGPEGNQRFRQEVLSEFDNQEENEQAEKKFGPAYGQFVDTGRQQAEKKLGIPLAEYQKGERRWSRGLDEMPEYWMQGLQYVEDPDRLRSVLKAEEEVQKVLQQKHGIENIDQADTDEIKKALAETERVMPPAEWGEKGEKLRKAEIVIFSDIDGTFKEPGYSDEFVRQGIEKIGNKAIVAFNSSWSTDGLHRLQQEFGLQGPVIAENGGEICIPTDFIDIKEVTAAVGDEYPVYEKDGFIFIQIGEDINSVMERFDSVRRLFPGKTYVTGEMDAGIIMSKFGVDEKTARERQQKQSEARANAKFVLGMATNIDPTPEQLIEIKKEAERQGITITRAKILWHIMASGFNKGVAAQVASKVFRSINPAIETVGVGDADNDIEMLKACDRSYLVGDMDINNFPKTVKRTKKDGPEGWLEMINDEIKIKNEREVK